MQDCGHRFTASLAFSASSNIDGDRQVCATSKGAKNLIIAKKEQATGEISETKSILFEFAWWMKKQGYAEQTIESRLSPISTMLNRGADLNNPESVKETIVSQD